MGQGHQRPSDHHHLGVAEVVLGQAGHEEARDGGEAARHEGPLAATRRIKAPQEGNGARVEDHPDGKPRREPENPALHEDLERCVVHVPRALLGSFGLRVSHVLALDSAGAPAEERALAPHGRATLPHVAPLLDARLARIDHGQDAMPQLDEGAELDADLVGHDEQAHHDQGEDARHDPPAPPERGQDGRHSRCHSQPGPTGVSRDEAGQGDEPEKGRGGPESVARHHTRQRGENHEGEDAREGHVDAEEGVGSLAVVVDEARPPVDGLGARTQADLDEAHEGGARRHHGQRREEPIGGHVVGERVGGDVERGGEQQPLAGDKALGGVPRHEGGEQAQEREGEHGRPQRPGLGAASLRIAQPPQPEKRQEGEGSLRQRDREAEPEDESAEEGAAEGGGRQYAFRSKSTRTTVSPMIFRSSQSDQRSMYSRSYSMRFSSEVLPRSPCTCAQPVTPDLT